jgi:small-conductance mechanosensitive channel
VAGLTAALRRRPPGAASGEAAINNNHLLVVIHAQASRPRNLLATLCFQRLILLLAAGLASKVDRWFSLLSQATLSHSPRFHFNTGANSMNSIVYIVGLVVIIGAILAFLGLR